MTISNSAVAKEFANEATKGNSKSMYIEGDTVYSYGPHFPIAKRIPGGYVFNSDNYSASTNRHKSDVWSYIHKDVLWELPGCDMDQAVEVHANRMLASMKKIPESRSWFSRYLETLEYNFNKAIEASKGLDQDIQPLYDTLATDIAATSIKRIKKEGKIPKAVLSMFSKSKFLGKDTRATASFN